MWNYRPEGINGKFTFFELGVSEVKLLRPLIGKRIRYAYKRYQRYLDIRDSGEATERECDLLVKWEDEYTRLKNLLNRIGYETK